MPLAEGEAFIEDTTDPQHERPGAAILDVFFPELFVDCCLYHVASKRYLCAREPGYFENLSAPSLHLLSLQGGSMSDDEVAAFESHPHLDAIIPVRWYDEVGKEPGLDVLGFASYVLIFERLVAAG